MKLLAVLLSLATSAGASTPGIPVTIMLSGTITAAQGAPGTPWPITAPTPLNVIIVSAMTATPTQTSNYSPTNTPAYSATPTPTPSMTPTYVVNWQVNYTPPPTPYPAITAWVSNLTPQFTQLPYATAVNTPTQVPTNTPPPTNTPIPYATPGGAVVVSNLTPQWTSTPQGYLGVTVEAQTYATALPTATPGYLGVTVEAQTYATPGGAVSFSSSQPVYVTAFTPTVNVVVQAGSATMGNVGVTNTVNVVNLAGSNSIGYVNLSGPAAVSTTINAVGQGLTVTTTGFQGALFVITSVMTGSTVVAYRTIDSSNYVNVPFFYGINSGATPLIQASQSAPAALSYIFVPASGSQQVVLRCTVYNTGSVITGVPCNNSQDYAVSLATGASTIGSISALPAGTNTIGYVSQAVPVAGNSMSLSMTPYAASSIGFGVAKASAGVLAKVQIWAQNACTTCTASVHLYNLAAAPAQASYTAGILGQCTQVGPGSTTCDFGPQGISFGTGISCTLTGNWVAGDVTSPTAASVVNFEYK
jgi:hypothetical protein